MSRLAEAARVVCDAEVRLEERGRVDRAVYNFVYEYVLRWFDVPESARMRGGVRQHIEEVLRFQQRDFSHMAFASGCLVDVAATAALVKEIVFAPGSEWREGVYRGVDLGSGSGVLTAAMGMRGVRQGAREVECVGYEYGEQSVQMSQEVLDGCALPGVRFAMRVGDVTTEKPYVDVASGGRLHAVVSETINSLTLDARVDSAGNRIVFGEGVRKWTEGLVGGGSMDPFERVMQLMAEHVPAFVNDAAAGRVMAFPNVADGSYVPYPHNERLLLKTNAAAGYRRLHDVGDDFAYFAEMGVRAQKRFPVCMTRGVAAE